MGVKLCTNGETDRSGTQGLRDGWPFTYRNRQVYVIIVEAHGGGLSLISVTPSSFPRTDALRSLGEPHSCPE